MALRLFIYNLESNSIKFTEQVSRRKGGDRLESFANWLEKQFNYLGGRSVLALWVDAD
jgi:hypothetical protein